MVAKYAMLLQPVGIANLSHSTAISVARFQETH
jgi:hypothetical protein